MRFFVCIAGLPIEAAEEVAKDSSAIFTGEKGNSPIVKPIREPFAYRPGMSEYYHDELARRISQVSPGDDVGVVLVYVNYQGSTRQFLQHFFPFAITAPVDPFYQTHTL